MKLILTQDLREGMIVSKTIYRANGSVVISKGMELKKRYIDKLNDLGISSIYIEDREYQNTIVDDVVKEETRKEAILATKTLMKSLAFCDSNSIKETYAIVQFITDELLKSDDIIIRLAEIRAVDDYTFGHSVNVCILSIVTGIYLGYDKEKLLDLGLGAILHDIGKTKIPLEILNKPKELSQDEYNEIKNHTVYGYNILRERYGVKDISASIALMHHERFDGNGYPDGKKGDDIHEYARIVSIADVYDALTSDRVYRKKMKVHNAVEYLISMGGHQFDNKIVRKFVSNIALYPIGQGILLSTGEKGYVIKITKGFPNRPMVRILYEREGNKILQPYDIDLMNYNSITIIDTADDI